MVVSSPLKLTLTQRGLMVLSSPKLCTPVRRHSNCDQTMTIFNFQRLCLSFCCTSCNTEENATFCLQETFHSSTSFDCHKILSKQKKKLNHSWHQLYSTQTCCIPTATGKCVGTPVFRQKWKYKTTGSDSNITLLVYVAVLVSRLTSLTKSKHRNSRQTAAARKE